MANMKKYEVDEVNCEESFVTVSIRGDMLATVAKCLINCDEAWKDCNAAYWLGTKLRRAGDMIYQAIRVDRRIAEVVVEHDGTVHDNFQSGDEDGRQDQIKTVA